MRVGDLRRLTFLVFAVGCHLVPLVSTCRAGLVFPVFTPGGPTFTSIDGSLSYDAASGHLQSSSLPVTLNSMLLSGNFTLVTGPASVSIDLFVNKSGNFVSGGQGVVVTGTVTLNGTTVSGTTAADPLLSGMITAFGSDPAGPPTRTFDGLFTTLGGKLTTAKFGAGGTLGPLFMVGSGGGFVLSAENVSSGILGNFTQSFSSSSVKGTTGAVVPEPSTLTLSLTAVALAVGWRIWTGPRAVEPKPQRCRRSP